MKNIIKYSVLVLSILFPTFVIFAAGQQYQPLMPIAKPGGGSLYSSNVLEYLKNIYTFGIAIVGALAVIKIVYGGIVYMLSDVVTNKSDAKKEIKAAVYGLLLALGSATILFTINPDLLKLNFNITRTDLIVGRGEELLHLEVNEVAGAPGGSTVPGYTGDVSHINWNDPNFKISENFTVGDVTKGDSARIPQSEEDMRNIINMANTLEQVQAGWGGKIEFTSWYRPSAVNASVGGATNSQHLHGNAVDIQPANGDVAGFNTYIKNNWGQGGVGTYDNWVHFDLGPQRRW